MATFKSSAQKSFLGLSPKGFHKIIYSEWGDPKNRDVVICVHGLTRNRHDFDFLAQDLAKDYRVICPDIVGRGDSDYLHDPFLYSYPQYLSDMNALIARLDVDKISWVGTSMGGLMGIMLASSTQTPVKKLVLNDIGSVVSAKGLKRIATYAQMPLSFKNQQDGITYLKEHHLKFIGEVPENVMKSILEYSLKFDEEKKEWVVAYDTLAGHTFSKNEEFVDVDFSAYWNNINCPVLVIRGENSDILEAEVAHKMTKKNHVNLIELPDVGHPPSLAADEQIQMIQNWLKK